MQPSLCIRHECQHYRHAMEQELAEDLWLGDPLRTDESRRTPGDLNGKRTILQTFHLFLLPMAIWRWKKATFMKKTSRCSRIGLNCPGIVAWGLTIFNGKPDKEQEEAWPKSSNEQGKRADILLRSHFVPVTMTYTQTTFSPYFMVISCLWSDFMCSGLD